MNCKDVKCREDGAVLVVAAFVMVVVIGMVALGIDGFRGITTHTEKRFGSDYAALSGLTAYLAGNGLSHTVRVAAAVARAESISSRNFITADNRNPNFQSGDSFHVGPGDPDPTDVGVIRFGRWWTEAPSTCSTGGCPCGSPIPCFQECPSTGAGCADPEGISASLLADSVSVSLKTPSNRPIVTSLAGVLGSFSMSPTAGGIASSAGNSSIATVAAKHTVFAIDLSRFTTIDTTSATDSYNPAGRGATAPREYAYKIVATNCSSPPFVIEAPFTGASQVGYQCVTVNRSGVQEAYLVANQANVLADVPKPHNQMLDSLLNAIDYFATTSAAGGRLNRLAVIGFDHQMFRERMWGFSGTTGLELVKFDNAEITTLRTALASRNGRLNAFLFPRPASASDTPAALKAARDVLKRSPRFNYSENSVALFTNGMTSCEHGLNANGAQNCINFGDTLSTQTTKHNASLNEIYEYGDPRPEVVTALFRKDKIKIHSFYFGRDTRSHSILIKSPASANCMNDFELRNRNFMNVVADNYANEVNQFQSLGNGQIPPANPVYSRSSQFFYAASSTLQGVWAPIRPACSGADSAALNGRCATQTGVPANLADPMQTNLYNIRDNSFNAVTTMDAVGRVLCDRNSVSEPNQIAAYLGEVLLPPSSLLVE
jgi:hypothetical protein